MLPYYLMIGVPALFALVPGRGLHTSAMLVATFLLFVSIIGLRYDIGPDWFAYTTHFERYGNMEMAALLAEGEFGWSLLVLFVDYMGWGMTGLTMTAAIVFCLGVFAIARACQEPMLALVAAVPYLSIAVAMSGMRQAMAMGIIFLILAKWYRWPMAVKLGLILLASTFHFSALALLAVVVFEVRMSLIQRLVIAAFITIVVTYSVASTTARIEEYAMNYGTDGRAADAQGALFHVLLTAAPALTYFFYRRRWNKVYGRLRVIDLFAGVGVVALFFVFLFPTVTDRMTLYFAGVALIIQANLPRIWRTQFERYIVRAALIVLNVVAMSTFLFAGNKAGAFVPYASIFSVEAQNGLPRAR